MKLKEVPRYVYRAWQLKKLPSRALRVQNSNTQGNTIVSFTSISARLPYLHLVARSLISQSLAPEKIILWLHSNLETSLPKNLTKLVGDNFEIRFSAEHCPHRKLVEPLRDEALKRKIIVTCDDDMMYPTDWFARLIQSHTENPRQIVAHECRKIVKNSLGVVLPYSEWVKEDPGASALDTIAVGYGGVLYPPNCLAPTTTDRATYMALAPRADDLWFKAMSMLNGTPIRRCSHCEPMPTPILGSQKVALKRANIKGDENREQWLAIAEKYNLRV